MAILNEAGIAELLHSPGVKAHLHETATKVVEEVVRIAPRHTGHYDDSIQVGAMTETPDGPAIAVESTDFAAHLVEFGSMNNPPYAPLRRAPRNLGITIVETPKA
jgi:hypothetical protein